MLLTPPLFFVVAVAKVKATPTTTPTTPIPPVTTPPSTATPTVTGKTCSLHSLEVSFLPLSLSLSLSLSPLSVPPPTLPQLLCLSVPEAVSAKYFKFGILLLDDTTGSRVAGMDTEFQKNSERIILKILQEWLEGKGLPVSWETLVKTLRDTGLPALADTIQTAKMP